MSFASKPEPKPKPGGEPVWQRAIDRALIDYAPYQIIEDMRERHIFGLEKYGVPLSTNDGRNALIDAYQEALDGYVYLVKEQLESLLSLADDIPELEDLTKMQLEIAERIRILLILRARG